MRAVWSCKHTTAEDSSEIQCTSSAFPATGCLYLSRSTPHLLFQLRHSSLKSLILTAKLVLLILHAESSSAQFKLSHQ